MLYGNPWRVCLLAALASVWLARGSARAQDFFPASNDWLRQPLVGRDLVDALCCPPAVFEDNAPTGSAPRFRLFHMTPGFLYEPPGLDGDDDPPTGDPGATSGKDADGVSRIQVTLGADNPYFDYRWRGDPGGVGYYKVHSQMQLVDTGYTSLCLNCLAFTPAGLESGGVSDGATVISPSVAWFQELGGGTALQGYVGSNIRANTHFADRLDSGLHCGMACQCPVPGLVNPDDNTGFFLFVQALGRYRYEGENVTGRPATWDFVPGVHWRIADSCWMAVGASRNGLLTCSWRY